MVEALAWSTGNGQLCSVSSSLLEQVVGVNESRELLKCINDIFCHSVWKLWRNLVVGILTI